jgi:hypothetical protein
MAPFTRALCNSLALSAVLAARVDDDAPPAFGYVNPTGYLPAGAVAFDSGAHSSPPLQEPSTLAVAPTEPDLFPFHHIVPTYPVSPPYAGDWKTGGGGFSGLASLTHTRQAHAATFGTHYEAQAARSNANIMATEHIHGAQVMSHIAEKLANEQAVAHDKLVVGQATSQTAAQRHATEVARAHAHEAAEAHTRMVQAQESEKIHRQEAKLAHAQAVTERRAIEVHAKAEEKIKQIEAMRAKGIHDINQQADHKVASTHGGALKGIEDVTLTGKDDVLAVREAHPSTHDAVNTAVEQDAKSPLNGAHHPTIGLPNHPTPLDAEAYGMPTSATEGLGSVQAGFKGYPHMFPLWHQAQEQEQAQQEVPQQPAQEPSQLQAEEQQLEQMKQVQQTQQQELEAKEQQLKEHQQQFKQQQEEQPVQAAQQLQQ